MELTKNNFKLYAMRAYDNPYCLTEAEFHSDLFKSSVIKKLLSNYIKSNEINTKLLINNVICFYNVFKHEEATKILASKLTLETQSILNSVLFFLNLPVIEKVQLDDELLRIMHDEYF